MPRVLNAKVMFVRSWPSPELSYTAAIKVKYQKFNEFENRKSGQSDQSDQ